MNQRTTGATSRTSVHTLANVVTTPSTLGTLKIFSKAIYALILLFLLSTNTTFIYGFKPRDFSEQGTVPEVDIQLEPTKRWKASSESLDFIRDTMKNYIAKEIAEQTPVILNGLRNRKDKKNSLIFDGKIVKND